MFARTVRVLNKTGLHARPATLFVETANRFRSSVSVVKGEQEVDAKSVLGLMLLEIPKGTEITIKAQGEDEVEAVNTLAELVEKKF
ncbi:HPr family phosphocarrier protein, partial [Desulfofundulus sp.]|uniref:HPr family phosphocarrier protein n=1 Tax=Desulfofundulus sp. TaxID=2282750 RepID=UPI003C7612AD